MEPEWRIELLGGLRVCRDHTVVTHFRTRKMAGLLAYLAYFQQRSHPREVLIDLLWPEADLDTGRHNLSMALTFLRQVLEPPGVADGTVVVTNRHTVALNSKAISTDVAEFEAALRAVRVGSGERRTFLRAAVAAYGGELLPGYYDDWIAAEQQRLDELYFGALRQLIYQLERENDLDQALQYALRAVTANRCREDAHREVMRLYTAAGRPGEALRQYEELERILKEELDTAPEHEIQAFADALRATGARPLPCRQSGVPAAASAREVRSNQNSAAQPSPVLLPRSAQLEPVGGAVPLGSKFYVTRTADRECHAAIDRKDSIVLIKGARQVGKTSLLARVLQQAREAGARVALTHFQTLNAGDFDSSERLLLALAETLAEQLDLETRPLDVWDARRSPNLNFRRYLRREVLGAIAAEPPVQLVWALEEVDRLFSCAYGSEIFGLFRSWHDERALEPDGPWSTLTLAIAYSTEAHLFITDLNQSPFNVGTRLSLHDFDAEQVADLNVRHGSPLRREADVTRYYRLLGGHPYLVRRGLHEMVAHGIRLGELERRAGSEEWIFSEHLRRILLLLSREPELCEGIRMVLEGSAYPAAPAFHRLRSAGVLVGETAEMARPRCQLYAAYLKEHLL